MTPRQLIGTLRRRWYVLAIAALCTAVGIGAVHKRSLVYQGCSALFVTAPQTHQAPNVYTNQQDSLDVTTGVVTRAVMSSAVQAQLRSEGFTATYDAEQTNTGSNENPAYGQPTLQICASSKNPAMAVRTTQAAIGQFRTILHDRQLAQHVAPRGMIGVTVIASPYPQPVLGRPSQALIGVALLGLVGGLALALWSDPLLKRWQRRKAASRSAGHALVPHP